MAMIYHLVLSTLAFNVVLAYQGDDLPIGPYCGLGVGRHTCCYGRQDDCRHTIKAYGQSEPTYCYCDDFCKHNADHDDCCPDFEKVCQQQPPQALTNPPVCYVNDTKMDECNQCTCENDVDGKPFWHCETETCLMSRKVYFGVNKNREGTWRAANYSQFAGKKLNEGLKYKLGTLQVERRTRNQGSVKNDIDSTYPEFDARTTWPGYISPIMDQGWCGSDWAVSTASIISDRYAIANGGAKRAFSPQSLLCNKKQKGCDGGYTDKAWIFATKTGIVDETCLPYTAAVSTCPYDQLACTTRVPSRDSNRYQASVAYKIVGEYNIMKDLMVNGPVQATMTVYHDFFHYRDGVYRRTSYGDQIKKGLHAVKIIGWGEDKGLRYWTVANSWGREWGENGYFRIVRGENECDIESFVVASTSVVVTQKK